MSSYSPDRQRKSTFNNEKERALRKASAELLVDELIGDHQEEFMDPEVRLEFIGSLDNSELYGVAQHINRRMRGMDNNEIRNTQRDRGAYLPMLHTPSEKDKQASFDYGFNAIKDYLEGSDDSIDRKLEGVALGLEALIVRVHPFDDGNGRTSRFLGEFVQNGTGDINNLIDAATSSSSKRPRTFSGGYQSKESALENADNTELMLDDEEREELRRKAKTLPSDPEATYLTIKRYLEDDSFRNYATGRAA